MGRCILALLLALLVAALILGPPAESVLCDSGGGETAGWVYWDYGSRGYADGGWGYADLNASYYHYLFSAEDNRDLRFEFSGEFPYSRYMSFTLYDHDRLPVEVLNDFEIEPDPGSWNPFRPGVDRAVTDRSYTVRMVPQGSSHAGDPNTLVIPADVEIACLMMRVYLPDDGQPPDGGVGMPSVSTFDAVTGDPASGPEEIDSSDYFLGELDGSSEARARSQEFYEATCRELEGWRIEITKFLPQHENPYILMPLAHPGFGNVALVRFRAPAFTDTGGGGGAFTGQEEVRYFSVTVGGLSSSVSTYTAADSDLMIDEEGYVNLVIGCPQYLVSFARSRGWNPITTRQHAQPILVFRQMLPEAGFEGSFAAVPTLDMDEPPQPQAEELKASNFVGEWAPQGYYCTTGEFINVLR